MKRILVTGATGFIGGYLVRNLLRTGWQVGALVRPTADRKSLSDVSGNIVWCPYAGDYDDMAAAIRTVQPDVVVHLASQFLAVHAAADLDNLLNTNVRLGLQLAEAMTTGGCRRLVNAGTAWQHFRDESYCPANLYAASKQAYESMLRYYVDAAGMQVTTLKLFDTYGAGDTRRKLLPLLKKVAQTGESLDLSPGEQRVDLVHADDVAEAFCLAATQLLAATGGAAMQDYAVSSGQQISLRELVRLIEEVLGHPLPVQWGVRPYRVREVMQPWTRGFSLPGWQPRVDLRAGLASYFRDAKLSA